jgi:hypothetical protein
MRHEVPLADAVIVRADIRPSRLFRAWKGR